MRTKNDIAIICVTAALLLSATPVMAQGLGARITNITNNVERRATESAQRQTTALANLQGRADSAITNRINDLNKLINRIQNDKRLSTDEKSGITAEIQTDITGLNTLKAKIDADTDITTAQTDSKTIFTGFRVYEVVNPQTQLTIMIDNLQTTSGNVATLSSKLQTLITTLQGQGKDVTALQADLTDINSNLTTINTKLAADKTTVMGVSITTSNPQTIFSGVRTDLSGVRGDFEKIRTDIENMSKTFRTLIKPSTTATPSATAE